MAVTILDLSKISNSKTELEEIKKLLKENNLQTKQILNIDEASKFLTLSKSTLYKYTSSSKITFYKSDKKIYFKRTDLEKWMLQNKVQSFEDINEELDNQMFNFKNKK